VFQKFAGAVLVVLIGGVALAAEYKGRITKIDTAGKKITITTGKGGDAKDTTLTYNDDTKFVGRKGKDLDAARIDKMLEKAKKGIRATIKTKGEKDNEVVEQVTISVGKKKKAPPKDD
jgi:hypothetical protein